jgi:hypothetical protein
LTINFYTEPSPLFVGQPGFLPLQVVNSGRNSAILGNLSVTAAEGEAAQFTNNTIFVGALDPGGFFPLDAQVIPEEVGPLDLLVGVNYTDDFNQTQVITETLTIEVMEAPIFEEEAGPGVFEPPPLEPETLGQRIWRFIRGLLGLSSGRSQPPESQFPGPAEIPFPEQPPIESEPPG